MRKITAGLLTALTIAAASTAAQTTEFIYQGKLTDGGTPASTPHDFEFKLFVFQVAGPQLGATRSAAAIGNIDSLGEKK